MYSFKIYAKFTTDVKITSMQCACHMMYVSEHFSETE